MKLKPLLLFALILFNNSYYAQEDFVSYQWLHPKPFGISFSWIKAWDENNIYGFGTAGNFLKSTDGGETFVINSNAGVSSGIPFTTFNDINAAYFFDQNTGYTCGLYGVSKTTNGGETFNEVGIGFFSSAMLYDIQFINENIGFVSGSGPARLSKTTDGGNSWEVNIMLPSVTYYKLYAFNQNRIVVAGQSFSYSNVRVTTDGGSTWQLSSAGSNTIYSLAFYDSLVGFAGSTLGNVYKTNDGGITWNQLFTIGAPQSSTFNSIYIQGTSAYFVDDDSLLFITTDRGVSFTRHRYLPSGMTNQKISAVTKFGSNIFVAGKSSYLFKSTDDGLTWQTNTKINKIGSFRDIWGDQTGKIIAIGGPSIGTTNDQVLISEDHGINWNSISINADELNSLKMLNTNFGYAVGDHGKIWKTMDGGYNWDLYQGTTTTQRFNAVDFYNSQYGFAVGRAGQIWKTVDGGYSWLNVSTTGSTIEFRTVSMIDSTAALVAGASSVFKTVDGGVSWITINPSVPAESISKIKMVNSSTGYIIGGISTSNIGYVFKTTDAGNTWLNLNFPYSGVMLYDFDYRRENDFVVVGFYGGIFHTTNDGASWSQFNVGSYNLPFESQLFAVDFIDDDTVIVAGVESQIIKIAIESYVPVELTSFTATLLNNSVKLSWQTSTETNNQGFQIERREAKDERREEWKVIGFVNGIGTTAEKEFYSFVDNEVNSGKQLYRLKQIDFNGTFEYSITIEVDLDLPTNFSLKQNYPNPFNPSTIISWQSPVSNHQTLKVYDVLGNEIATLVDEYRDAGSYNINFDASRLSSGVYFYTIKAGEFVQTKKMLMIK